MAACRRSACATLHVHDCRKYKIPESFSQLQFTWQIRSKILCIFYSSTHILARTSADHSVALGHSQIGRRLGTYLSLCRGRCRWWLSRLFAARCLSGTSLPSSTPVASKGRSPWKRRSQECHRRKPRMQPVTGRGAIGLVSDSQSTVPSHAQAIGRP